MDSAATMADRRPARRGPGRDATRRDAAVSVARIRAIAARRNSAQIARQCWAAPRFYRGNAVPFSTV